MTRPSVQALPSATTVTWPSQIDARLWTMLPWLTITPLGAEVEPAGAGEQLDVEHPVGLHHPDHPHHFRIRLGAGGGGGEEQGGGQGGEVRGEALHGWTPVSLKWLGVPSTPTYPGAAPA